MQTLQSPCCPPKTPFRARLPKSFLFLPNACLSPGDPTKDSFVAPLSFLFSIACSGPPADEWARGTPHSAHVPLPLYTSKPRAKCCRLKPLDSIHAHLSAYS